MPFLHVVENTKLGPSVLLEPSNPTHFGRYYFAPEKGRLEYQPFLEDFNFQAYIDTLIDGAYGLNSTEKTSLIESYGDRPFLFLKDKFEDKGANIFLVKDTVPKVLFLKDGVLSLADLDPQPKVQERQYFFSRSNWDGQYQLVADNGAWKQVYYLDENLKQLAYFTYRSPSQVMKFAKDSYGTLWVATHDGLLRVFPQFTNFFVGEDAFPMLSSVHALHGDRQGRLWFGSYGGGFAYIQKDQLFIPPWNKPYRVLPGVQEDEKGDLLFISSPPTRYGDRGLFKIDASGGIEHLEQKQQGYFLGYDDQGKLLYGTQREGLWIQQIPDCFLEECWTKIDRKKGFKLENVLSAVQDTFGRYWMTRPSAGVAVYLPAQDTVFSYLAQEDQPTFGTMATLKDKEGTLFFGTKKGLARFNPPEKILPQENALVWLTYLDTTIRNEENYVYAVKTMDKRFLAYTSNNGFHLLDKTSLNPRSIVPVDYAFQGANGYLGLDGEQNAIWVDSTKGAVWMANSLGITRFNARFFYPQENKPTLMIDAVGGVFGKGKGNTTQIRVAETKKFEIRYHLRRSLDPFTDEYYRLQIDQQPPIYTRDSIFFMNDLNPGRHQLEVQGFRNGMASEVQMLKLYLPRPFYEASWFIILMLATVSALGAAYYFYDLNEYRKKKELSNLRIRNLVDNFNPHFLGNSFNWIKNRAKIGDDKEAAAIIVKIEKIIRTLFEHSRHKRATHSLAAELLLLQDYFDIQKVRYGDQHQYQILDDLGTDLALDEIQIPLLSLQILCDNAIEHGLKMSSEGNGRVWVKIEATPQGCTILIEDDGIGRAHAATFDSAGFGSSVKMLQELVEELNQNNQQAFIFKYEDGIFQGPEGAFGTRCRLFIPQNYRYEF